MGKAVLQGKNVPMVAWEAMHKKGIERGAALKGCDFVKKEITRSEMAKTHTKEKQKIWGKGGSRVSSMSRREKKSSRRGKLSAKKDTPRREVY